MELVLGKEINLFKRMGALGLECDYLLRLWINYQRQKIK